MTPEKIHSKLIELYEKPVRGVRYFPNRHVLSIRATRFNEKSDKFLLQTFENDRKHANKFLQSWWHLRTVAFPARPGYIKDLKDHYVKLVVDNNHFIEMIFFKNHLEIDKYWNLGVVPVHARLLLDIIKEDPQPIRAGKIYQYSPGPSGGYRATVHFPIYPYTLDGDSIAIEELDLTDDRPVETINLSTPGLVLDV